MSWYTGGKFWLIYPSLQAPPDKVFDYQISWFQPLSRPRTLIKPRAAEFPFFAYGTPPYVAPLDSWWRDFDPPPKRKPSAIDFPPYTEGIPPRVDIAWWRDFDPPPKAKRRVREFPFLAMCPTHAQTVGEIGWFQPWTQPKRHKFGLDCQFQMAEARNPIIVYGPRAMGYIIQ